MKKKILYIAYLIIVLSLTAQVSSYLFANFNTSEKKESGEFAGATEILVTTNDDNDDGKCDITHCSFREAIILANATEGAKKITFSFPQAPEIIDYNTNEKLWLIKLNKKLPSLKNGFTWIDGKNGDLITNIEIDASNLETQDATLKILSAENRIQGLKFSHSKHAAILILSEFAHSNEIIGNKIVKGNKFGILIENSSGNTVGTTKKEDKNTIKNNADAAIIIYGEKSEGNTIQNNEIIENGGGIVIDKASKNIIQKNKLTQNNFGIYLAGETNKNEIKDNSTEKNNKFGIYIKNGEKNVIGNFDTGEANLILDTPEIIDISEKENFILPLNKKKNLPEGELSIEQAPVVELPSISTFSKPQHFSYTLSEPLIISDTRKNQRDFTVVANIGHLENTRTGEKIDLKDIYIYIEKIEVSEGRENEILLPEARETSYTNGKTSEILLLRRIAQSEKPLWLKAMLRVNYTNIEPLNAGTYQLQMHISAK